MLSVCPVLFAFMAIFGAAWIVADSKISLPFRTAVATRLGEESLILAFLECPMCQSFWYGLTVGRVVFGLAPLLAIAFALASVTFTLIVWRLTDHG